MDTFQSNLTVRASKIIAIHVSSVKANGNLLIFDSLNHVNVNRDFMEQHRPNVNGYYVIFPDGYETYIIGDAFEKKFNKIEEK